MKVTLKEKLQHALCFADIRMQQFLRAVEYAAVHVSKYWSDGLNESEHVVLR